MKIQWQSHESASFTRILLQYSGNPWVLYKTNFYSDVISIYRKVTKIVQRTLTYALSRFISF